MSEGEEKPKSNPSVSPDRAAALARKLSGRPPALGRETTGAIRRVPTPAPASDPAASDAQAQKEAILAARRASIVPALNDAARPGARRSTSVRPPAEHAAATPKTRKSFLALGALLLLAAVLVTGFLVKQLMHERSDEGRVHAQLLAWEFGPLSDPAVRDAAFVEIDRMGPRSLSVVIDSLADSSRAEQGSSRSNRTMQTIAHQYLLRYAAQVKAPPPDIATELAKSIFDGVSPPPDRWMAARDAWRAWLEEQQNRGVIPKG